MPFTKKQQIRGIRIMLTVFYGFLLSNTIFRYFVHGIVETVRSPRNIYAIGMIVIGAVILISMILATHATWSDNNAILLVSGFVLVFVFILTLVFGVIRIVKNASNRVVDKTDESLTDVVVVKPDLFPVAEAVTQLTIELIAILFALLGTFILIPYIKRKKAQSSL